MRDTPNWLPWLVSGACLGASFAYPHLASAIWICGVLLLLPFLVIDLRRPVNYKSLDFDENGFRYSSNSELVENVKWSDVSAVYYRRLFNPFANQIDTEFEFRRAGVEPVVVLIEWPQRKPFARALTKYLPNVSEDLLGQAMRRRDEGRWPCTRSEEELALGTASPNPSIERTSPGKPGAASHVKR